MARQRSDAHTRSARNSQLHLQARRWHQLKLTGWWGTANKELGQGVFAGTSRHSLIEGNNIWSGRSAREEFSGLARRQWRLIKRAVQEGKHTKLDSVFCPLELLLIVSAHRVHVNCRNSIQLGLRECVWNMSEMLPAAEQLSIHRFIRTLSSHFKNASGLINKLPDRPCDWWKWSSNKVSGDQREKHTLILELSQCSSFSPNQGWRSF